ncbi:hypothetical protein ZYGR_0H03000 [Zygosaccharomyces rouxii]|uniref:ZYRO0B10934p n=2 Tax=Zygosaccharomyces rouxii TaxID=4956 RepID=C5DRS6_ZYGRC|nr:uncharacterized protein ZYRO0B10934g [Zygosaccharomyces rouxii]KAH9199979.1 hypothetical protein LQ764DRAFT_111449 [Zygosaccharomyces rouxii]GAV47457.1 hypothetical protein ZYGR_0H03000 [Zygosaccharomyces rouxii]CAR26487.1 ZYRO0B10934p [Zygosaccharomyces rouxii]
MSAYIRGPICGVGNCPSRLWRIIDGRRTCQYGHVMEGDVEFNDEDEDATNAGVVTRRLNLTTGATGNFQSSFNSSQLQNSQNEEGGKKIFGPEARLLFIRSLQFTLKRQSRWLIEEQKLPQEFDKLVKIIWMKLLKSLENDDNNDEFGEQEDGQTFDSNEDQDRFHELARRRKDKNRYRLSLVSTLAILYMSSVQLGIPIYTCDLIKWTMSGRLPYFKSSEKLPESWRVQLPNYYLGVLEGGKGPQEGQLFTHIARLCTKTDFIKEFNHRVNYECLIFKLVLSNVLPPEFYLFAIQLIRTTSEGHDFELNPDTKPQSWIDLQITAYFLLTIRWVLMYDTESYQVRWIHALIQRQKRQEVSTDTIDQNILKLSQTQKPTQKVFEWTDEEMAQYLSWAEEAFLPLQRNDERLKIDQRIAKRKLHKLFPLESETFNTTSSQVFQSKPSFLNELQERYAFFQGQFESTDHRREEQRVEDDRIKAINSFENLITQELVTEFSISLQQLRLAIKNISHRCFHRLKQELNDKQTSTTADVE